MNVCTPVSQDAHSALTNFDNNLVPFDGELYLIKLFTGRRSLISYLQRLKQVWPGRKKLFLFSENGLRFPA